MLSLLYNQLDLLAYLDTSFSISNILLLEPLFLLQELLDVFHVPE